MKEAERSLSLYLQRVIVDCVPDPKPYGDVREKWQEERDTWLTPAFEFVAGVNPDYKGQMNFFLGYSKGHDKTSTIARYCNWVLAFSPRKNMRLFVGAKDVDQAAVLLDAMQKEYSLNPWLQKTGDKRPQERIDFKRNGADSNFNGGQLRILASDAGGNQGKNPDIVIADELSHWDDPSLFDSLYSGVGKRGDSSGRQRCLFVIITNAGFKDTWQWRVRQLAEASHGDDWFFYSQPEGKLLAGWLSASAIEKQKRLMTPSEGKRLWGNQWVDLTEERGAFQPEDIDKCIGEPRIPQQSSQVVLGIDYGGVRDRTALALVWFDGEKLHVPELQCWQGSAASEVQISEVDAWLDRKCAQYPNLTAVFDRYQMASTMQRLELQGIPVKKHEFRSGKQNHALYETLQTLLQNGRVCFSNSTGTHPFDGSSLVTELKRVLKKKMASGFKIDHDDKEHDDRVIAVGMAAIEAVSTAIPGSVPQKKTPQSALYENQPIKRPTGGGFTKSLFAGKLFGVE